MFTTVLSYNWIKTVSASRIARPRRMPYHAYTIEHVSGILIIIPCIKCPTIVRIAIGVDIAGGGGGGSISHNILAVRSNGYYYISV